MEIMYGRTDFVRPYGRLKKMLQTNKQTEKHTSSRGNTSEGWNFHQIYLLLIYVKKLNVTDGTIQEQTCRTNNITFSRGIHVQCKYRCNAMQAYVMQSKCNAIQVLKYNAMQYNAMQC
jgi:hypothetical protein